MHCVFLFLFFVFLDWTENDFILSNAGWTYLFLGEILACWSFMPTECTRLPLWQMWGSCVHLQVLFFISSKIFQQSTDNIGPWKMILFMLLHSVGLRNMSQPQPVQWPQVSVCHLRGQVHWRQPRDLLHSGEMDCLDESFSSLKHFFHDFNSVLIHVLPLQISNIL